MTPDDTGIAGLRGYFPSTRLSLLEAVSSGLTAEALDRLATLYWKPVYRFLRLKFRLDNEDAKDLTQGFFTAILDSEFLSRYDPARGSFRTYLRMAAERFAANRYAAGNALKRGGGLRFESLDEHDLAGESPEDAFDREWRRQLFSLALDDLRACAARDGKQLPLAVFEAYDLADGERPSYADLAARYDIAVTSVTNHLAWARRTLRSFVNDRLRGVTPGEAELRREMRRLWT